MGIGRVNFSIPVPIKKRRFFERERKVIVLPVTHFYLNLCRLQ